MQLNDPRLNPREFPFGGNGNNSYEYETHQSNLRRHANEIVSPQSTCFRRCGRHVPTGRLEASRVKFKQWIQDDRHIVHVLTVLLILVIIVAFVLAAMCAYLLVFDHPLFAYWNQYNVSVDDDAMLQAWRLYQTALQTNDEYHKKALHDFLNIERRLAEQRVANRTGRIIQTVRPERTEDVWQNPSLSAGTDAASVRALQQTLEMIRKTMTLIETHVPKDGLTRASAFVEKEFGNPKLEPTSVAAQDNEAGYTLQGGLPTEVPEPSNAWTEEQEVYTPVDDIEILQLVEFIRHHQDASTPRVKVAKRRLLQLQSVGSSVHGGKFYYPLRRHFQSQPFTTETDDLTSPWYDALLHDYGERHKLEPKPFQKPKYAPDIAKAIKSHYTDSTLTRNTLTIFASIASYRDRECWPLVQNIQKRATNTMRLFLGIAEQYRDGDPSCMRAAILDPQPCPTKRTLDGGVCFLAEHIRVRRIRASVAQGPTYGRYMAMLLYRGEDYAMVLDSHNYFVVGWDARIVKLFLDAQHPKMVFSHYPDSYTEKSDFRWERSSVPYLCQGSFLEKEGYIRLHGILTYNWKEFNANAKYLKPFQVASLYLKPNVPRPLPQPWAAGGFLFSNASIMREVPFDPHLSQIFDGEEILYSARLWTHGYDIHSPTDNICYHSYGRPKEPKVWTDSALFYVTQQTSRKRIQYLLRTRIKGTDVLRIPMETRDGSIILDIHRFAMGRLRTIEDWYKFAGADPVHYTLDGRWCGAQK